MSLHATTERTYRRAYVGLSALAGLAMAALIAVGHPVVAAGAFAACFIAAAALRLSADRPLFDERDRQRHYRAAGRTMTVFGWACAAFFPALTVLVGLGYYDWPAWLTPVALFIPVLYGTYVLFVLADR